MVACSTLRQDPLGRQATARQQKLMTKSHDCARVNNIPPAERAKNYPFINAREIQLVSFKSSYDSVWGQYFKDSLPRKNDTVVYSKLFEIRTLTQSQIDTLTDLIFNYDNKSIYKPKRNVYFIGTSMNCYNPRNAILFIDKDRKVFEFIEICFECDKFYSSSDSVGFGSDCNQKLELIKDFFHRTGIEYGITTGLMNEE
jgi:hypothetical protein